MNGTDIGTMRPEMTIVAVSRIFMIIEAMYILPALLSLYRKNALVRVIIPVFRISEMSCIEFPNDQQPG
jgi:hypothetical protein